MPETLKGFLFLHWMDFSCASKGMCLTFLCLLCLVQVLKCEVELMARMAKTIDSFTQNQTRLVVIIDGLDACEQDKVLQMLDTVRFRCLHICHCGHVGCMTSQTISVG